MFWGTEMIRGGGSKAIGCRFTFGGGARADIYTSGVFGQRALDTRPPLWIVDVGSCRRPPTAAVFCPRKATSRQGASSDSGPSHLVRQPVRPAGHALADRVAYGAIKKRSRGH